MKHISYTLVWALLLCGTPLGGEDSTANTDLSPMAARRVAEIERENALRQKCFEKYGDEIRMRTAELTIQMHAYMRQADSIYAARCLTDAEMRDIRAKMLRAEADKSINAQDLRQKRHAATLRINSAVELVGVRDSIADIRRRIEEAISAVVGSDTDCRESLRR